MKNLVIKKLKSKVEIENSESHWESQMRDLMRTWVLTWLYLFRFNTKLMEAGTYKILLIEIR